MSLKKHDIVSIIIIISNNQIICKSWFTLYVRHIWALIKWNKKIRILQTQKKVNFINEKINNNIKLYINGK